MLFPKAAPILIRTAVLLFPNLIALDYQGPVEVLGFLDPNFPGAASLPVQPQANIELTYVAPSLAPVHPIAGPLVVPDMSYEGALASGVQFDAILVPGGVLCLYLTLNTDFKSIRASRSRFQAEQRSRYCQRFHQSSSTRYSSQPERLFPKHLHGCMDPGRLWHS